MTVLAVSQAQMEAGHTVNLGDPAGLIFIALFIATLVLSCLNDWRRR